MLTDPLSYAYAAIPGTFTGGTLSNFRRTAIGKYVSVDGAFSSDQPARLWLSPTVKLQGPSSYKSRFEMDKNVSPVNGVQQADDTLRVDITVSGNLRSFSAADLKNALSYNYAVLYYNFDRIISGET